ncbi:MAG TPA: DUF2269 family protein [Candidatus Acidoferrum sp.]|jgi:hypothetical protein
MNSYIIVLFLHLVGMAALFFGYGLEWTASALLRGATTAGEARSWLRIYRASLPVSGPGLLVLILTGFYMAGVNNMTKEGWVIATVIGIVLALAIGFGMLLPRFKKLRPVLQSADGTAPLSAEVLGRIKDPVVATLIRIRTMLAVGIVYLMAAKPTLVPSFVVLLASIGVGVILAAPAWSREK